ncbi:MAG: polyprenyl synthetase family protein [Candidatus Sumerlaeia bacterium]|nr:polyprenyl synthetase family protein [Candidatus Sumerlaeia bacterium]
MILETLAERIEELGEVVDRELLRQLEVPEPLGNLHGAALYSMGLDVEDRKVRGKRIRPVLSLLTGEALGIGTERPLAFACAIELLHNFALVHDDIEDGDSMRRGRPAVHEKYGLAHGINTGDYLFGRVFQAIAEDPQNDAETMRRLLLLATETMEHLFRGQCLDISARESREFSMEEYTRLVERKTGSYLAAPMLGAAIIAGADDRVLGALRRFGRSMGPLFQIKDDLIDLTTGKGREHIGNDIREGKRSYLVAAFCQQADASERNRLFDLLDKERNKTTTADVEEVIGLFQRHGIMEMGEKRCEELMREGLDATAELPSALGAMLRAMAEYLTRRTA